MVCFLLVPQPTSRINRNNGNSILKPNDLRIKRSQKQFPLGNGIENTTLPFPERPRYCNTIFKLQLKRLVKCRNRRYCCSHCEQQHQCPPFTTLQRNNFYKVLVEKTKTISHKKKHVNRQTLKGKHLVDIIKKQ